MMSLFTGTARGKSQAVLASFVHAFLLQSQGDLPSFPNLSDVESSKIDEFNPLRPFPLPDRMGHERQFQYRGEQILQGQDVLTLIHGAVESEQLLLLADRITYDRGMGILEAEGHIRLEGPDVRMRCERLRMDMKTKSGEAWFLNLELPPSWSLRSKHVTFADNLKFWNFDLVEATPCPDEKKGWSAKLSHLSLAVDGFAKFRHARILVSGVPILYFPWAMYPAKYKRSSGLLFPEIGFSNQDGVIFRQGYFQTLGDTADFTVQPKLFSKRGVLWGGELRWHPELTHYGSLSGSFIRTKFNEFPLEGIPRDRYRYQFRELWQREDGWQFTADINQASDALLDAHYGNNLVSLGGNVFNSETFLGKNFSWGAFSLTAGESRTFYSPNDPFWKEGFPTSMVRQNLPTAQLRLFAIPMGPLYLDGGLAVSRFANKLDLGRGPQFRPRYPWTRADGTLRVHGRLGQWGPFRSDAHVAGRFTYYSASLVQPLIDPASKKKDSQENIVPNTDPFKVEGKARYRWLGSARLQLSGPQVGRTYEKLKAFGYAGDLKHVADPFIAFTLNTVSAATPWIPRFDEVDSRPGVLGSSEGERSIEIGFKQHILGRQGKGNHFADLVRWRISSRYHFTPILLSDGRTQKGWASLDNDIDAEPNDRLRLSFRRSSELGSSDADNSLSAEYTSKQGSKFGLAFFSTGINRFLVRQKGIQLGGIQRFDDDRWRLEYQGNYDFRQGKISFAQAALAYVTPCLSTRLRYSHILQPAGSKIDSNCLEVAFTLKNLGDLFKPSRTF